MDGRLRIPGLATALLKSFPFTSGSAVTSGIAVASAAALLMASPGAVQARITSIVITSKTSPAFNGQSFGSVGTYEQLVGTAYGEVDPRDPRNAIIQDIALAPRNQNGMVAYSMDINILKPVDPSRGNHVLLFDVVNRGSMIIPGSFNVGATAANPAGDGFLESQGFTMVWAGWQADLVPSPATGRIAMAVPVAHHPGGGTITGIVRSEISMLTATIQTSPIGGGFTTASRGYQPLTTDTSHATLTQRVHEADPREPIPGSQWAFGSCNPAFPNVTPDPANAAQFHVCKQGGFDPDHIYELIYTAQDPLVLGLGFASTRDFVSFLHHSGSPQNPLYGTIQHTLVHGTSQSGRYVRTFLDLGFNQDESGGRVFDGMNPHIASARIAMNIRFGQPGRVAGLQHTEHEYPGAESPITWDFYEDPLTRTAGDMLQRCRETHTCPKILQTVTDTEYWQSSMSSDTTDAFGRHDLTVGDDDFKHFQSVQFAGHGGGRHDRFLPENIRLYHLASTQHGGYSPVGAIPPAASAACQQLPNANSYTYNLRAILIALKNWVVTGATPPDSRYPLISGGTLVPADKVKFPVIPGVSAQLNVLLNQRSAYFRGPQFDGADESGIETVEPPVRIADYRMLAPQVDADGNDIDGVHSLSLMVPLGTYTGWNTRKAGFGEGDACDLTGSFIPFPKTAATAGGDPRKPVASRYPTTAAYDNAVQAAANTLVSQGFLLPSDAANAVAQVQTQAHNSGLLPP
jgi:Alpha/beta hydrolase domain